MQANLSQLWGAEVIVGGSSAASSLVRSHSILHLTHATLVPCKQGKHAGDAGSVPEPDVIVSASTEHARIALCRLSESTPQSTLNLMTSIPHSDAASDKVETSLIFHVDPVSRASSSSESNNKWSVQLSGYTYDPLRMNQAGGVSSLASREMAASTSTPSAKRKMQEQTERTREAVTATTPNKKQKTTASAAESTPKAQQKKSKRQASDDEDEGEDEQSPPPAPKSKPSTPKSSRPSIITLKNGLKYQDTKIGTGPEASDRSNVSIRYRGSLASNGKVFDSNMPRGQPLRFKIGSGDVIPGFEQGTKGMKVGGTRTVVIPPHLGYGARGAPPEIPGNATLVFDLQLVSSK